MKEVLKLEHILGVFVQNICDVQLSGYFPHPTIDLACGDLIDGQRQGDIFGDGQGVQQVIFLKHKKCKVIANSRPQSFLQR